VAPAPVGGRFADGAGSVIPCFARHDLNAAKRLDPGPCALLEDELELVDAVLVELLAELPHAASVRQAPSTDSARAGRMQRLIVGW
jgi:hypothetical protein